MPDRDDRALHAIPCVWGSAICRSKLEAKWLVVLDCLRVPWVYEIEGYRLKLGDEVRGYLPDLWLPRQKCFIEIKPPLAETEPELYAEFARLARRDLILLEGSPWVGEHEITLYRPDAAPDPGYVLALGRVDHALWLLRERDNARYPLDRHVDGDHWPLSRAEELEAAFRKARDTVFWSPKR